MGEVEYIGFISDATPKYGGLFAHIERHISLDKVIKKAVATQQLIHCASIKESLNADGIL